jgi:hypothetical protein
MLVEAEMVNVLVATAAFASVALVYKLATAGPEAAFDLNPEHYSDPDQQKLVELLIADASGTDAHALVNFIRKQRWGGHRLRNRLICAEIKIRLIAEPAAYQRAKHTARRIILRTFIWDLPDDNDL